ADGPVVALGIGHHSRIARNWPGIVAPSIGGGGLSSAGVFPFRLGQQPITSARQIILLRLPFIPVAAVAELICFDSFIFTEPDTILSRTVPGHHRDRTIEVR